MGDLQVTMGMPRCQVMIHDLDVWGYPMTWETTIGTEPCRSPDFRAAAEPSILSDGGHMTSGSPGDISQPLAWQPTAA